MVYFLQTSLFLTSNRIGSSQIRFNFSFHNPSPNPNFENNLKLISLKLTLLDLMRLLIQIYCFRMTEWIKTSKTIWAEKVRWEPACIGRYLLWSFNTYLFVKLFTLQQFKYGRQSLVVLLFPQEFYQRS